MSGRGKFFIGGQKMRKFGIDDRFFFYDGRPDFGAYGPPLGPPGGPPYGPGGELYPPPPHGAFGMPPGKALNILTLKFCLTGFPNGVGFGIV